MNRWKSMADIRREYGDLSLNEMDECPINQFKRWFEEVSPGEKSDPTAMTLSTVDDKGQPDSRVVLLKGVNEEGFIFYTNYQSSKGIQLCHHPYVALNFYWPQMSRQVRVRGRVKRTSKKQSDEYFYSRPLASQISAMISPQSQEINSREELETKLKACITPNQEGRIARPKHWGGYIVIPNTIEFWQGRDNRLHDRICYQKHHGKWTYKRLAP